MILIVNTSFITDAKYSVHIQATEKLLAQLDKDGGLQRLQVLGEFLITTASDKLDRVIVKLKSKNSNDFQFRVRVLEHPNLPA